MTMKTHLFEKLRELCTFEGRVEYRKFMNELMETHPFMQGVEDLEQEAENFLDDIFSSLDDLERLDSSDSIDEATSKAAEATKLAEGLQGKMEEIYSLIEELRDEIVWQEIKNEDEEALEEYLEPALKKVLAEKIQE